MPRSLSHSVLWVGHSAASMKPPSPQACTGIDLSRVQVVGDAQIEVALLVGNEEIAHT